MYQSFCIQKDITHIVNEPQHRDLYNDSGLIILDKSIENNKFRKKEILPHSNWQINNF